MDNNGKMDNNQKFERYKEPMNKFGIVGKLVVIVIVLAVLVVESMYTLRETETAVVTTFGVAQINDGKGLQFKIPFFQEVTKVDTTIKGFSLGYIQNTDGTMTDVEKESTMITSDYNFINADFYVSYEVTDPIKYLYNSNRPEEILKNITQNCVRSTMSAYTVDSALTTGKSEIQANIKQMIVNKLEQADIGITLIDISMQDVEPPTEEIKNAFKEVETAKQQKESLINEANQYRNEQLPAAEAKSDKILQDAEAQKVSRTNEAVGQVARFEKEYEEYCKYPLITKRRMFYETMEQVLPNLKVVIESGDGTVEKIYPVESFSGDVNVTAPEKSDDAKEE